MMFNVVNCKFSQPFTAFTTPSLILSVILEKMPVHSYTVAMTCGGCSGAITRILTKKLDQEGEKFDVSLMTD